MTKPNKNRRKRAYESNSKNFLFQVQPFTLTANQLYILEKALSIINEQKIRVRVIDPISHTDFGCIALSDICKKLGI